MSLLNRNNLLLLACSNTFQSTELELISKYYPIPTWLVEIINYAKTCVWIEKTTTNNSIELSSEFARGDQTCQIGYRKLTNKIFITLPRYYPYNKADWSVDLECDYVEETLHFKIGTSSQKMSLETFVHWFKCCIH